MPALARWARRFLNAVDVTGPMTVGGHDIGGAVAQHLATTDPSVERLTLMNSVLCDSWPVPAVERFRDPAVAAAVTVPELLEARAQSLGNAISRPLDDVERSAWLAPWRDEQRVRSWTAMAGAADARYTLDLIPRLRERALPTLLIWGEDDAFQPVRFAERYAAGPTGSAPRRQRAGENRWPSPGRQHVRHCGEPMAATEENPMTVDITAGPAAGETPGRPSWVMSPTPGGRLVWATSPLSWPKPPRIRRKPSPFRLAPRLNSPC